MTEPLTNANPAVVTVGHPSYVVLRKDASGLWAIANENVPAPSSDAAIKLVCKTDELTGTHVAVPARSWKPVTVTAETTTFLKLEDA